MADEAAISASPAPVGVSLKERTDEQIATDLSPLTSDEQLQAVQLKVAIFDALASGKILAPPVDKYDEVAREQMHDALVLVTQRLEHVEDQLRHFTVAIQPQPGEPLPPEEPLKTPDPLDPRTAEVQKLIDSGMTFDDALAQVDKSAAAEPAADPAPAPEPAATEGTP